MNGWMNGRNKNVTGTAWRSGVLQLARLWAIQLYGLGIIKIKNIYIQTDQNNYENARVPSY